MQCYVNVKEYPQIVFKVLYFSCFISYFSAEKICFSFLILSDLVCSDVQKTWKLQLLLNKSNVSFSCISSGTLNFQTDNVPCNVCEKWTLRYFWIFIMLKQAYTINRDRKTFKNIEFMWKC